MNAVKYQTCPNHESDNHFFAKIPGGGGPDPRSPPSGSALVISIQMHSNITHSLFTFGSCLSFTLHPRGFSWECPSAKHFKAQSYYR